MEDPEKLRVSEKHLALIARIESKYFCLSLAIWQGYLFLEKGAIAFWRIASHQFRNGSVYFRSGSNQSMKCALIISQ